MDYTPVLSLQASFGLALIYIVVSLVRFSLRSLPGKHYPPGPPSFPFIGNAHLFASTKSFLQFTELGKKYGDIVGLKAGPGNIVILNSVKLVHELLGKHGSIYSGRPVDYVFKEHIIQGSKQIVFLANDRYLQQFRAAASHILSPKGAEQALPIQEAAAADLMLKLLETPASFLDHFETWALVGPMQVICGDRTTRKNPKIKHWFFENQEKWLNMLTPGLAPPVNMFPVLKYVPEFLARWKQAAKSLRENQRGFYYMMLDFAKKEVAENSVSDGATADKHGSLMAKILRGRENGEAVFDDDELAYFGGGLVDAATDTTLSTGLTFVKTLAAHPHIMKRARGEVDALRDSDSPPRSEDIAEMPFLTACFLEVLRWRPATPTLLPRLLESDNVVGGYHLKKGTVVIQNTWAINHDPEHYEDPGVFNPDRFLSNPYGTKMSAEQAKAMGRKQSYTFGLGRRRCPGDLFARNAVLIAMAKLVWAFDIIPTKTIDTSIENGYHGGLVIGPEAFEADFVPRSPKHRQGLLDDFQRLSHLIE
ncbi:hypothetical protein DL770_009127 [Monosporascus sp. CRB-9-2]|nr:hypothetical protein DL770_009127 [Monosporascus sp. CRB-9-2]